MEAIDWKKTYKLLNKGFDNSMNKIFPSKCYEKAMTQSETCLASSLNSFTWWKDLCQILHQLQTTLQATLQGKLLERSF